jgi:hypothetical protein
VSFCSGPASRAGESEFQAFRTAVPRPFRSSLPR